MAWLLAAKGSERGVLSGMGKAGEEMGWMELSLA